MDFVSITCSECKTVSRAQILELYYNKTINIPCCNCGIKNKVYVPAPNPVSTKNNLSVVEKSSRSSKVAARLVIPESLNVKRQSYIIREGENIIGRKSPNFEIEIPVHCADKYMSRRHCIIHSKMNPVTKLNIYTIREYQSKNKIIINDKLMENDEEIVLTNGENLILGTTLLIFESNEK